MTLGVYMQHPLIGGNGPEPGNHKGTPAPAPLLSGVACKLSKLGQVV